MVVLVSLVAYSILSGSTGFLGVIQVSTAIYWFPGCFYRFSGCLHGFSGTDVSCLGGYLISSVVTLGSLGGNMNFLGVYTGFLLVGCMDLCSYKSVCFNVRICSS